MKGNLVLACDTSGQTTSLALIEGDTVLVETTMECVNPRSSTLLTEIAKTLDQAGYTIRDMDLLAVTIGPGSFTGIRVGMASMKGLAYATKTPLIGVDSLSALAYPLLYRSTPVLVAIDARKSELYAALYDENGSLISGPAVWGPDDLLVTVSTHGPVIATGDGIGAFADSLKEKLGNRVLITDPEYWVIKASIVAKIALKQRQHVPLLHTLEPMYLKRPSVRVKSKAL